MSKAHNKPGIREILEKTRLLFAADGPLASLKPGYRERPEQIDLADAVEGCFESKGVLLSDAPTGTGKSLGYLAPAILRAAQRGEKVVISTATLALQAQLLSEDLPPLRKAAAELLGYPEEEGVYYAVMKGRRNFLCTKRHLEALMSGTVFDTELVANLDRWAAETETGDREDLPFAMPISAWAEVASDGDDCSPRTCPYREGCHYYAHRDAAAEADILIVNHALLLANAASYGSIFDTKGRHLIIDEAHRLEEIMAEAFGVRVSYARILYVLRQARKRCEGAHDATNTAEMAAELFFEDLLGGTTRLHASPPGSYGKLVEALRELRRLMHNFSDQEIGQIAQRSTEFAIEILSASVGDDLGRQTSQKPAQGLRTVTLQKELIFELVYDPFDDLTLARSPQTIRLRPRPFGVVLRGSRHQSSTL